MFKEEGALNTNSLLFYLRAENTLLYDKNT